MTTALSDFRKRVITKTKKDEPVTLQQIQERTNKNSETIVNKQFNQIYSPEFKNLKCDSSLILGKQLRHPRVKDNKMGLKKNNNLNLSDYLRLYSMSKKSQSKQKTQRVKSQQKNQQYQSKLEKNPIIDTAASIKLVREETKKQIQNSNKKLKNFLNFLDETEYLKSDEESLVFMCNVLHIFEDKIVQSVKFAQQLVLERKKEKQIQGFKNYSKNSSPLKRQGMRSKEKVNYSKMNIEEKDRNYFSVMSRPKNEQL